MFSKRSQNMELTLIIFSSCINTSKIKYRTSTLFRRTFLGKKSTLFWCTLFNVVLMGKKSTSFQRIWLGELSHVTSMLSTLFRNYPRYFVGQIIDVISISFLWHDFDGLKIVFILKYLFIVILIDEISTSFDCTISMQFWRIENWHNSNMLFAICFWKTRTAIRFYIFFDKLSLYQKRKSLGCLLSM